MCKLRYTKRFSKRTNEVEHALVWGKMGLRDYPVAFDNNEVFQAKGLPRHWILPIVLRSPQHPTPSGTLHPAPVLSEGGTIITYATEASLPACYTDDDY
jgi:hypothetical protein